MKTYNCKTRISKQARARIARAIETHEKYKNSYFWSSNGNASSRRREENRFADNNPKFEIETKRGIISVEQDLSISCKNVYYSSYIFCDGEKKDIRILKKLINK